MDLFSPKGEKFSWRQISADLQKKNNMYSAEINACVN